MASRELRHDFIGRDVNLSRTIKDVANEADRGADKLDDMSESTRGLDDQIAKTTKTVAELREEIARTGDVSLFRDLSKAENQLKKLVRIKDMLPSPGEMARAGAQVGAAGGQAAANSFMTSMRQVSTATRPILAGVVVASLQTAAPVIGGVLAGAVVGAAGAGGLVGGFAIAARHTAVKQAATSVAQQFESSMERAGRSFVPVTVMSLGRIRGEIVKLEDEVEGILADASRFAEPLTEDALRAVRAFIPGFARAVGEAGPVIDALGDGLVRLGRAGGRLFGDLADRADEGARALQVFFLVVEAGIGFITTSIDVLAGLYGLIEKGSALLNKDIQRFIELGIAEEAAGQSTEGFSDKLRILMDGFQGVDSKAAAARVEIENFAEVNRRLVEGNLGVRASLRDVEAAIDDAAEAFKDNGATLDETTPKGRANAEALDRIASAANAAAADIMETSGNAEHANAVLQTSRQRFIALADKMGLSSEEAIALANNLFALPSPEPTVTVHQKRAMAAIREVQAGLGKIRDKNITIGVWWKSNGDLKLPGGTSVKGASMGGPVEGVGPKGVDSVPMILAPGEHVLTARDVDRMGGHEGVIAFRRALASGDAFTATPPPSGGSSRPRRPVDDDRLVHAFRRALSGMTLVLDDRTGRTAQLRARVG